MVSVLGTRVGVGDCRVVDEELTTIGRLLRERKCYSKTRIHGQQGACHPVKDGRRLMIYR